MVLSVQSIIFTSLKALLHESITNKLFVGLFEAMKKQLKYNERNEVRVKPSKISKKHYFFQKSNHFYDFFGQKVIIMTKK